jgi:anhydro-N-acetylmuramic acid kinase
MTSVLPFATARTGEDRRWLVGVLVSARGGQVAAAAVRIAGRGLAATAEVAAAASGEVPKETAALLRAAVDGSPCPAALLAKARAQLAEIEAAVLGRLLADAGLGAEGVLAAGVHDPGFWTDPQSECAGHLGWCDAARVAELTGLNVLDAFPARDLAQGGLGGPLTALPQWLLLRKRNASRVLLDLGRTTRLTYLPAYSSSRAAAAVRAFEVGPGTALLDLLAHRLSEGQHPFDPGGRMAAQGRRLGPLADRWLADPCLHAPLPRWHPRGVRPERFVAEALHLAVESGWSVRDLLCTATHFIAETVGLALRKTLPEDAPVDELIVTGGGQHNGMLLREIALAAEVPLAPIDENSLNSESLGPACVALLAMLYLDGVPANATATTGAGTPRLLGRLTPGSPQNWQRLLQFYTGSVPLVRPLRSAV